MQVAAILFGALFTAAVSLALGKLLFRYLKLQLYRVEEEALAFVCGSTLLSMIVFALACVKLARRGVFLVVGLAILPWGLRLAKQRLPRIPRLYVVLLWVAIAVFSAVYLANSVAPEKSPDGSTYHLGIIGRFDRAHGFELISTNMYANLSMGIEMLFLFAYSFGRHSAAATFHLCFLYVLVALMVSYGRRFGMAQAGVAGALFVFLSPVVGIDAVSAYNDVALATVLFAIFYILQIWDEERKTSLLILAGGLAGFAYAVKYTAFLAVPYAIGFVLWKTRKLRPAALMSACALIFIVPWVAKNWILLGNPVSPFFNSIFPNRFVHIAFEKDYAQWMSHYGLASKRELPLAVLLKGTAIGGIIGPLFFLSPLALLGLRWRMGRRLLFAALLFALPYAANVGTRFLIPSLPFLSLALGLGLSMSQGLTPLLIAAHAILAWPPILNEYTDNVWRIERVPHKAALRIQPEEEFLSEKLDGYMAARMVETNTPPGARVFSFSPVPEAYSTRNLVIGFQSAEGELLRDMLLVPLAEDFPPVHRFDLKFPPKPMKSIRIRQTTKGTDIWSITEVRVFSGGTEISPAGWTARARPNAWDAGLALDRNPATRWRSWQAIDDRMYFEIDFGKPVTVDMVRVEASSDQWQTEMALDGVGAFPDQAKAPPVDGLRKAATQAVQARGIDYLLVYDFDFTAKDMRERAGDWGLELAGERGNARLYRLTTRRVAVASVSGSAGRSGPHATCSSCTDLRSGR